MPLVADARLIGRQQRKGDVVVFKPQSYWLAANKFRHIRQAVNGTNNVPQRWVSQRRLHGSVWQFPLHRQIVAARALLHERFQIITLAGLQINQRGLLAGFLSEIAPRTSRSDRSDRGCIRRILIAAQQQKRGVVAGNPKCIIAIIGEQRTSATAGRNSSSRY